MNFLDYDVPDAKAGDTVIVQLDKQANVRLLDELNFMRFRRGERHDFYGGRAVKSPVRLTVPSDGDWHVVVDLGGHRGTVRAAVGLVRS